MIIPIRLGGKRKREYVAIVEPVSLMTVIAGHYRLARLSPVSPLA